MSHLTHARPDKRPLDAVLDVAATAALRAPSVLNTQPWQWVIHDGIAELRSAPRRQLAALDPEGRMLTVSCGAALDYALVALRTEGYRASVRLLPDQSDPELLATIHPMETVPPTAADYRRYQTTLRRHTDRRPFGPDPITLDDLAVLRKDVEAEGVRLHLVMPDELPTLAAAALSAANTELSDPESRAELARWTHKAPGATSGLATNVTVPPSHGQVPLRPGASGEDAKLDPGPGDDSGARYLILSGDRDGRRAWLTAGVALSRLLLSAADRGLATSPMTDVVEVAGTRVMLRRLLRWQGHPYAVVRIGHAAADFGVPAARREGHDEAIKVEPVPAKDVS